ncbi:MAG: DNA-binding protein [Prevotella sp.]|nr:DNA-binding protein [Prevotella sp.]
MAKKETKTKNFILRVDSDTMDAIEAWAADEFRSTNGQLQWIITEALRKAKRLPKRNERKTDQKGYPQNDDQPQT